jgi:uncharacterized repeat protein (TIGR03837 family)
VLHPIAGALRWDIFCRVIDNFGDIGVAWRLARRLAGKGHAVRLITDDAGALEWMAPPPRLPVTVLPWPGPTDAAEVVIEAFGCELPEAYVKVMRAVDPVWINLEYLSAEDYVERSHGLPSPRADGLRKWFLYPGLTPRTGGLLRESGLLEARSGFDGRRWLREHGWSPEPGERVVTLFCYENPMLGALLQDLAHRPTLLLLTPGPARAQVAQLATVPARIRTLRLPWLAQDDFDRLLWASDLNLVRGEDSLVRALWAGAPLLWQAYPQHDGAHAAKVQAMARALGLPAPVATLWQAWNGLAAWPGLPEPESTAWQGWTRAVRSARAEQASQVDLVTRLSAFVRKRLRRRPH